LFLFLRTKDQLLARFPTLLSYSPPAFTRKDREPNLLLFELITTLKGK
jgi:hypothetical protein